MAEVARRAGVSAMTVSYCYNQPDRVAPATLRRVLDVAAAVGYVGPDPTARSLRRRHNGAIGVVLGEHLEYAFEDPQARRFLAGVAEVCRERGTGLNLIPTTGQDGDVERVRSAAVDGYILWTTVEGGPAVPGGRLVGIDDRASATALAAQAFRGARRPAVLSFPFDRDRRPRLEIGPDLSSIEFPITRDRLAGVYDYCREVGLEPAALPIAVAARNDRSDAAAVAETLLEACDPDAVVAMSDQLAFAVLDAVRRRHLRVPDDVAVGGWDDDPDAGREGLTTIAQSLFDQGRTCALAALGDSPPDTPAAWTVVVRSSTR
jgi:DNA-binding LacI/PurR family transcriptional regulator